MVKLSKRLYKDEHIFELREVLQLLNISAKNNVLDVEMKQVAGKVYINIVYGSLLLGEQKE